MESWKSNLKENVSLPPSALLFDPIRQEWVKETPEEKIRQQWIKEMVEVLGFPRSLMVVEKELRQLPHLTIPPAKLLRRRVDLLVFAKTNNASLFPLLLIECKAVALTPRVAQQVVSYNDSVQAAFVAIANEKQILTGAYDKQAGLFRFEEGLSSYQTLCQLAQR